jgi:nicotinamidase-related amidase
VSRTLFWDVDTQVDFMHADGKLYVPDAEEIIPTLSALTDYAHRRGIRIVASADDHVPGSSRTLHYPRLQDHFSRPLHAGDAGTAEDP